MFTKALVAPWPPGHHVLIVAWLGMSMPQRVGILQATRQVTAVTVGCILCTGDARWWKER